jgi:hypothetical protein
MNPFERAPTFDDPIGMLHACHRRIERALDAMARVAAREASGTADAAHRELKQLGQELLGTGRFFDPLERTRFQELIRQLQQLYAEHIRREDQEILLMAASLLDLREKLAVGAEMAARRGIDWREHRRQVAKLAAHR